jgi:DNA-damage-inducible protein J
MARWCGGFWGEGRRVEFSEKVGVLAQLWHFCAMSDTTVRARVDLALKEETDRIFSELGISTTEAIRMFLSQVKLRRGLPFPVGLPSANDDLLLSPNVRQAALDSF